MAENHARHWYSRLEHDLAVNGEQVAVPGTLTGAPFDLKVAYRNGRYAIWRRDRSGTETRLPYAIQAVADGWIIADKTATVARFDRFGAAVDHVIQDQQARL